MRKAFRVQSVCALEMCLRVRELWKGVVWSGLSGVRQSGECPLMPPPPAVCSGDVWSLKAAPVGECSLHDQAVKNSSVY